MTECRHAADRKQPVSVRGPAFVLIAITALVLAALASACTRAEITPTPVTEPGPVGHGGAPAETEEPPPIAKATPWDIVTVEISGFRYGAGPVTVPSGTTIRWTNLDSAPHTATWRGGDTGFTWDSGTIPRGQSFETRFDSPGSYDYFCTLHPNMRSTVIIR